MMITPSSFSSFGELLRHLRLQARITQRDLAAKVGYNHAHLSRLENNQRIPDVAAVKVLFVPALDLGDKPEWAARLLELASLGSKSPGVSPTAAPQAKYKSLPASISRLPVPFTPLLGRDVSLDLARTLLMQPDVRLLTLVGPPGIGKTRLALELASELARRFADGALFVDLTPVRDATLVVSEVARSLDLDESTDDLSADLMAGLHSRQLLLILDNFEHVMDAASQVANWLQAAPQLCILVTSREPLHVTGEHELNVPPLPPEAQAELFVQRARAVQPDFALTPRNLKVVSEICWRLGGLPLAIELAAGRVKQLSAQAMAERLDQRLRWLTGGKRDGPSWRQTLRGAIDWSYNLLTLHEREAWSRMSVFAGGCSPEAAQAVTGASLEDLLALSDKSLISVTAAAVDDQLRFTLLDTLREYARERLSEDSEGRDAALRSHASYYLNLAEAAPSDSTGLPLSAALGQLELEYDNLRAAMDWALEYQPDVALRFVIRLGPFWYLRSHFHEARRWQIAALPHADTLQRLVLTRQLGETCWNLGEQASGRSYLDESVALARSAGNSEQLADGLNLLGRVVKDMGSFEEASSYFEEGLGLAREHGYLVAEIALLRNLGNICLDHGEMERALAYFEESLALASRMETPLGVAGALNNAGVAYLGLQDYERAKAYLLEALPIFQEYGNQFGSALAIVNIGRAEHARGALDEAKKNFETSLHLARETGRKWSIAYALSNLGLVACDTADWIDAEEYFHESVEISLEASAAPRTLDALSGWAVLLSHTDHAVEAAELVGLVLNHAAAEHEGRTRLLKLEDELRGVLPTEDLDSALKRGAVRTWEGAARWCLAGFPRGVH